MTKKGINKLNPQKKTNVKPFKTETQKTTP